MGAIASAEECVVSRTAFVSAGVRVRVRVRVCVAVSAAPLCLNCLLSKATRFMNPPRRSSTLLHTLDTLVVVPSVVRVSRSEPALSHSLSSLPPVTTHHTRWPSHVLGQSSISYGAILRVCVIELYADYSYCIITLSVYRISRRINRSKNPCQSFPRRAVHKAARRVALRYVAHLPGLLCTLRSSVTHRSRSVALSARRRSRSWLHVITKQFFSTPSSVTIEQSASGKLVLSLCQYGLRLSGFFETTSSPRSSCTNTYLGGVEAAEGKERDTDSGRRWWWGSLGWC